MTNATLTNNWPADLARAFAELIRIDAEERAYWASPEGRAMAQAQREAKQAAQAAARAAQLSKLKQLRDEVASLAADREALRVQLAATPMTDREARCELAAELNDVSMMLAQVNATAARLAKEIK